MGRRKVERLVECFGHVRTHKAGLRSAPRGYRSGCGRGRRRGQCDRRAAHRHHRLHCNVCVPRMVLTEARPFSSICVNTTKSDLWGTDLSDSIDSIWKCVQSAVEFSAQKLWPESGRSSKRVSSQPVKMLMQ